MKLPERYKETGEKFTGGGMSTAIVCEDRHLDRKVLVKSLENGVDQKRILDELNALSSIRSKHVVEIFDAIRNDEGDLIAIVEELITGEELNALLPISDVHTFIRHLYAIACGLSDIHAVERVHRDIKPTNMKFDSEGVLRIFDFGLSRSDADAATIGTWGTPGYIAPELCVAPDEKVEFTTAIDTYAFGATALKMILGTLPKELKGIPPSLPCSGADFRAFNLPEPIAFILNQCLSEEAKKRPEMSAVRDAIGSFLSEGKHKATIVSNGAVYSLDSKNPTVNLSGSGSSITINYNGTQFIIAAVSGTVSVNRVPVEVPHVLPGSCVLIFSGIDPRTFASFDISFPEVIL